MLNSYIQCAKRLGFLTGRFIGSGPNMENYLARAQSQASPSPAAVAHTIQGLVAGTAMYEEPIIHGDKETVQCKRRTREGNVSSHRPEYAMLSKERKPRGRPRKISFVEQEREETVISSDDIQSDQPMEEDIRSPDGQAAENVLESIVDRKMWALRRMPTHCSRKCFGMVGRKKCSNVMQSRSTGLVAPCFWSERTFKGKTLSQWMWFCSHDVEHTKVVSKQVIQSPTPPIVWEVAEGTSITRQELAALAQAGFFIRTKANIEVTPDRTVRHDMGSASSSRRKKWRHGISKDAYKRIEAANSMEGTFLQEKTVSHGQHVVFHIQSEHLYEVHIKADPTCTCPDFQKRQTLQKPFLACKHMYFVYLHVLGLQEKEHLIIHQPMLSSRDLAFILAQARKKEPTM